MRFRQLRRLLSALCALALGLSVVPTLPLAAQAPPVQTGAQFVPNEVLIQFRAGATAAEKIDARSRVNAARQRLLRTLSSPGRGELELASIPPGLAVADAVRGLQPHSAVLFAEPNWIYTRHETSNDPYYSNGSLWGMYGDTTSPTNQYGSQAGEAWAGGKIGSSNVYVGVIDTGIQHTHSELEANIWTNPFDPVDGVDNDGNGYVDDVRGWNFRDNNNQIFDRWDNHGTHVAGTIGAKGGNGQGVAGVNWNVTIISAKFLGGPLGSGSTADAVEAVDYITGLKTKHGLNIVATNNSWGGGGFSQALLDAIDRAGDKDILFVAAAGNDGANNDQTDHFPSDYQCTSSSKSWDCVIAVAATTNTGSKADFSNYGATSVDLGAPGKDIYSTVPNNSYASYSGTSMATPHVTGAAALYASANTGRNASQIKSAILSSTIPTSALDGRTVTSGRLDVGNLLGSGGGGGGGSDTTAPTVTITKLTGSGGEDTSGPSFAVVTNTDPSVTWNATEAGSYAIKFGGSNCTDATPVSGTTASGSYTSGDVTSTIGVSSLAEGANTVRVCVTDSASPGNTGSASASVTKDTTAPTVTSVAPADGASGVAISTNASATFSEAMDEDTLTTSTFTLVKEGTSTAIAAAVSYSSATATLNPNSDLEAGATYDATIKSGASGAKDLAGNPLAGDTVWSFATASSSSSTTMHISDLDGSTTSQGSQWRATVTMAVHDANHNPVGNATVSGSWSGGYSGNGNCTTSSSGTCSMTTGNIAKRNSSVTFAVSGVTHGSLTYQSSANHDSDGDSNGTTITVNKPQ